MKIFRHVILRSSKIVLLQKKLQYIAETPQKIQEAEFKKGRESLQKQKRKQEFCYLDGRKHVSARNLSH